MLTRQRDVMEAVKRMRPAAALRTTSMQRMMMRRRRMGGGRLHVKSHAAGVIIGEGNYETWEEEEEERRRRRSDKAASTRKTTRRRKRRKSAGGGAKRGVGRTVVVVEKGKEKNERTYLVHENAGTAPSVSAPQMSVETYEEEDGGLLELGMDGALLRVEQNGELTLFRRWLENGVLQLTEVTKASVQLPNLPSSSSSTSTSSSSSNVVSCREDNEKENEERDNPARGFSMTQEAADCAGGGGAVTITWPARGVLRVLPVGMNRLCDEEDWLGSLTGGFILQFTALHGNTSEATVDMSGSGSWYGGGHLMRQHWPLNQGCWEVGPFYPFDNGPNGVNTLLHPHWVTTAGLLVVANPDTPFLHVGMNAPRRRKAGSRAKLRKWGVGIQNAVRQNLPLRDTPNLRSLYGEADGQLRLQARSNYECNVITHPLRNWTGAAAAGGADRSDSPPTMEFVLSVHANVREATRAALKTLTAPSRPPPAALIKAPIWTTWARYHEDVDQRKVLAFAEEIIERNMPRSVLEIDDKWQAHYGDINFCSRKFPDPAAMVDRLHELGFKVTCWVMPFVEEKSEVYEEGKARGFFIVEDETEKARHAFQMFLGVLSGKLKPGFFRWWHSEPVVALDVTNPEAVAWFVDRLRQLQSRCNIDGFKFDAGEPTHSPIVSPSEYTRLWVEEVASKFEVAEVRTGHKTQSAPLLTRMGDRFSTWDLGNGLRSLIPTLMTSSVLGYAFCLPDMVGGNAYFGRTPNGELMCRWAQVNALMPAIQFSIAPWDAGEKTLSVTREALRIRQRLTKKMLALADEACVSLEPICRPMWWLDPEDKNTYAIDDQFAIGDDVVVAPVVSEGKNSRDIYLPCGQWVEIGDPRRSRIEGGQWLRNFSAPLEKLPVFERVV